MPKVISVGYRVFTNQYKNLKDEKFNIFSCNKCKTYFLITDADLENIPKRRTDNAPVFDPKACIMRMNTVRSDECMRIRREKGIETQFFHLCRNCKQPLAYQSIPHSSNEKETEKTVQKNEDIEDEKESNNDNLEGDQVEKKKLEKEEEKKNLTNVNTLIYLISANVTFPSRYVNRRKAEFECKICGYKCNDKMVFEHHKRVRMHENQDASDSLYEARKKRYRQDYGRPRRKNRDDDERREKEVKNNNEDMAIPPIIVG